MATPAPDWARAVRQAEQMVAESAGREPVHRAGREPTPDATGTTDQQAWQSSAMCLGLRREYSTDILNSGILSTYVLQPGVDLHWVKENMVEWMALATRLGKTVSSHFRWTDLIAALEHGGPTPFVFEHLARAIGKYPGLRSFAQNLVGAAGNRVQSVRASAVNLLLRHGDQSSLLVCLTPFGILAGLGRRPRRIRLKKKSWK